MKIQSTRARATTVDEVVEPEVSVQSSYSPQMVSEIIRCQDDPSYFIQKYLKVYTPRLGPLRFNFYNYQQRVVDAAQEFSQVIIKTPRQAGLTSLLAAYAVWYSIFNADKTTLVACPTHAMARDLAELFYHFYEQVPGWMRGGLVSKMKMYAQLENGSRVHFSAATESVGRGMSINMLLMSDVALYNKRVAEHMWMSIAPCLCTGTKLIAWSTPSETDNLFWTMWSKLDLTTIAAARVSIDWRELDHATDDWVERTQEMLGLQAWKQEYECEPTK